MNEEEVEQAVDGIKAMVRRAKSHAGLARGIYNKNKGKMDVVDNAQTLAQVSIAESLSAANELLMLIVEGGID